MRQKFSITTGYMRTSGEQLLNISPTTHNVNMKNLKTFQLKNKPKDIMD